jgi:Uma2 family endonuclease
MEILLEQLVHSPKLGLYLQKIHDILSDEQRKREEFYRTMTEGQKVEFINGEIIMHSPVRLEHNLIAKQLLVLLDAYVKIKDMGYVGYEKILIALTRNDYEPDICFFSKATADKFNPKQLKFPAPDFIVEVLSDTTEANDRGVKFEDYAAHGVGEYWIIDPTSEAIEQYVLRGDAYQLMMKSNSGVVKSTIVSGFEIPVRAIFDKDENLKALRNIIMAG